MKEELKGAVVQVCAYLRRLPQAQHLVCSRVNECLGIPLHLPQRQGYRLARSALDDIRVYLQGLYKCSPPMRPAAHTPPDLNTILPFENTSSIHPSWPLHPGSGSSLAPRPDLA